MIGDKIYKFRKSKNLSQEEFANSIGVTRQIVSKWESNQSIPGVDKLKKISEVYDISYEELLGDTEYASKKKDFKNYILWFMLMIVVQVIFIIVISTISVKKIGSDYKCIGSQTYSILDIYDSDDSNYVYVTLKNDKVIETVKVSRLISSLIRVDGMYEFIFRSNDDNVDIEYIFSNNEIINVIETDKNINIIDCK